MKKWIALCLAISMVFSMAIVASAEESQPQNNAIFTVLSAAFIQVTVNDTNVATVNVQLPLHKMIEAGIFESDTTQTFVDIVKNTWNEITAIPNQITDSPDKIQPTAIHVTYEVNTAGDLLNIIGIGVLPSGKPSIKENYSYETLVKGKTTDAVMLKLSTMVLDNKKEAAQFLKKEADDALLLVLNGYETADLDTLRARILNYINSSNMYKVTQVEFDQLDKYHTETVENKYDTEYTVIKDAKDKKCDKDYEDFDFSKFEKYILNKLENLYKLLGKTGNNGTRNAAANVIKNLEKKFGDDFEEYIEEYMDEDYDEWLENLFNDDDRDDDDDDDDDNNDDDDDKYVKTSKNNNGKGSNNNNSSKNNGKGKK